MYEEYTRYLPSVNFQDEYTWALHQQFKIPVCYVIWLLFCGFTVWLRDMPFVVFFCLGLLLDMLLKCVHSASKRAVSQHLDVLCEEVIEVQPGADLRKWDVVAAHINERLHKSGVWYSPYCVFDGRSCYSIFRLLVLTPFYQGKCDEQNTQLAEAVAAYEQSFNSWWQTCRQEAHACCYNGEQKLPRDIYRTKIAWLWRNTYESRFTRVQLASLTLMYIPWVPPPWRPFSSVFLCDPPRAVGAMTAWPMIYIMHSFGYYWTRSLDVHISHLPMLLAIIVEVKPKPDTSGWDDVARHCNAYLRDEKVRAIPEFFYDGKDCFWYFNRLYSSFLSKRFRASLDEFKPYFEEAMAATKEIQEDDGVSGTSA